MGMAGIPSAIQSYLNSAVSTVQKEFSPEALEKLRELNELTPDLDEERILFGEILTNSGFEAKGQAQIDLITYVQNNIDR